MESITQSYATRRIFLVMAENLTFKKLNQHLNHPKLNIYKIRSLVHKIVDFNLYTISMFNRFLKY